ncbi:MULTISPECIES: hypothetical protein [unclassified Pseudactinotalea]|uniref:hypothetical protein n=1 Tax=unclassified Pseudactinotalea TaxID=2649176 RepID=UPI00128D3E51|nr:MULTISPECIES: hypothetical protein [unclassified Pseudactinotalea]MPV49050.1 hypothetical protein [Pseudactinotalea sp. HY160]QGH68272.1 hypothetical protein GCE65_01120 [Pseudactinotalea sp. HY158]
MDPLDRRRIDDLLADMRAATSQLRESAAEIQRDREEMARKNAGKDAEYAQKARDGEFGADWRTLQQRIDAGMTTLADVLSGTDETPLAARIRDEGAQRLAAVTMGLREQDQRTQGSRFEGVNESFAGLDAAYERILRPHGQNGAQR